MIPFMGTPIWPSTAAVSVLMSRHACVSHFRPDQLDIALEVCESVCLDNGAFSYWKARRPVKDWGPFIDWVSDHGRNPRVEMAFIPDDVDGGVKENDALLAAWPSHLARIGVPVWHLHEPVERLRDLSLSFPRVALGSSGEFATPGTTAWWNRMGQAMAVVCDESGYPRTRLHGLRMLAPEILARVPLASADSTTVAINTPLDASWSPDTDPGQKQYRAELLAMRIESAATASRWTGAEPHRRSQLHLFVGGES